ncbi:Ankyrin repeat protein, partial [Globisporangium splendens]
MLYTYATVSKYSRDEVDWFFDAVAAGEHQVLSELISEGYSDTKMRDGKGNTPLFKVQDRDTAMVLLKYGADVNARNNNLETPLFAAARRRNAVLTKCLLQNGADVHAKDKNGYTALFTAACAENATVLINHGANVHALDSYGRTPLFTVVWGSTPDVVEALIKAGANVHATDRFGQTPMFQLYGKGRARCLEVLIRYGASVEGSLQLRDTPLHKAAEYGSLEVVKLLLYHGACVHGNVLHQESPLLAAVRHGHIDVAVELLSKGARLTVDPSSVGKKMPSSTRKLDHAEVIDLMIDKCDIVISKWPSFAKDCLAVWVKKISTQSKQLREFRSLGDTVVLRLQYILRHFDDEMVSRSHKNLVHCARIIFRFYNWMLRFQRKTATERLITGPRDFEGIVTFHESIDMVSTGTINRDWESDVEAGWLKRMEVLQDTLSETSLLLKDEERDALKSFVNSRIQSHVHQDTGVAWENLHDAALGLMVLHTHKSAREDGLPANVTLAAAHKSNRAPYCNCVTDAVTLERTSIPLIKDTSSTEDSDYDSDDEPDVYADPVRWQSPEVLKGARPTFASDIYTFGMCVLKAATKQAPWGNVSNGVVRVLATIGRLPRKPESIADAQWELVQSMCTRDPAQRTDISIVVAKLLRFAQEAAQGNHTKRDERVPASP